MQIAEATHGDVVVLKPAGALRSAAEALQLEGRLRALLEGGVRGLVLDCAEVGALGSAAVRVLLRAARKLAAGGGLLLLIHPSDRLRRTLEISGFDKDFAVAPGLAEALAAAAGSAPPPVGRELAEALLRSMGARPGLPAPGEAQRQALQGLRQAVTRALARAGRP
jgi:anti-anti-sigma factor